MLGTIAVICRWSACAGLAAALWLAPQPSSADALEDFHAAVERAFDQYQFAMSVLETGSQEQTSAEVGRLRQTWQTIAERFARSPEGFSPDGDYGSTFMQVDMGLITVVLIVELGNRDAARSALAAIGDVLATWSEKSAAPP
jgi:hypothetical protein